MNRVAVQPVQRMNGVSGSAKWIIAGVVVALTLIMLMVGGVLLLRAGLGPRRHGDLSQPRIHAYRDWQSTGVYMRPGDRIHVRASGTWLYTPGEYHGPEGHAVYRAPQTYPIPGAAGGVLLGRIGEQGQPFIIGKSSTRYADREGLLYMRINDDILSDNRGYVTVELVVMSATPEVDGRP